MTLIDIINKGRVFQVTGNNGRFAATILREDSSFIIQSGGKVNTEFVFEEDAGDSYLDTMEKYVDDNGKIIKNAVFTDLSEAAKSVCFDKQWEKVTYTDFSDKSIYELLNSKDDNTEIINKPLGHESASQNKEMNPTEMLAHALGKMLEPKPVDISEKSMQRIEEMHKPIEEIKEKEEIDNDFDWGEDESAIGTDELIGVDFAEIEEKLKSGKGAVILEGVPGTGKTKAMMAYLNSKAKEGAHIEKITFHQEYTYQEFIGGISCPDGEFKYIPGVFTKLCYEACKHPEKEYYLGIDEFSRGNTEAILGEVMTAICTRGMILTLSNGRKIKVPKNLFIIATMNVTDNSTKDIDIATLQRFNKVRLLPRWTEAYVKKVANGNEDVELLLTEIAEQMEKLNKLIASEKALGVDRVIGVRDITIERPTVETLVEIIENDLIKTIDRTIQMYYGASKSEIDNIIREMRGICNDFKKEIKPE